MVSVSLPFLLVLAVHNTLAVSRISEEIEKHERSMSRGGTWREIGDAVLEHSTQIKSLLEGIEKIHKELEVFQKSVERLSQKEPK